MASYTRALSINDNDITAITNMAHLHRIMRQWNTALHYYIRASKHHHGNPLLHYYAALMLIELKQYEVIDIVISLCAGYRWNVVSVQNIIKLMVHYQMLIFCYIESSGGIAPVN